MPVSLIMERYFVNYEATYENHYYHKHSLHISLWNVPVWRSDLAGVAGKA